jgi:hypothetical protein
VLAGSATSAHATFPGDPGPIAFQRLVDPDDEENVQIFSVAGPGAKARKLTSGGSGYNPDSRRTAGGSCSSVASAA